MMFLTFECVGPAEPSNLFARSELLVPFRYGTVVRYGTAATGGGAHSLGCFPRQTSAAAASHGHRGFSGKRILQRLTLGWRSPWVPDR